MAGRGLVQCGRAACRRLGVPGPAANGAAGQRRQGVVPQDSAGHGLSRIGLAGLGRLGVGGGAVLG